MGTAAANTEANARDIMMANADFILSLVTESMCVMRGFVFAKVAGIL